ncbi:hypothetical protein [Sporosarcina sp. USHLN248]|uniref:hypothetical protein n=1 Tax=Sporosarcina sp. USHLN248 TaxID=3081300 RepID=UPI00301AA849
MEIERESGEELSPEELAQLVQKVDEVIWDKISVTRSELQQMIVLLFCISTFLFFGF